MSGASISSSDQQPGVGQLGKWCRINDLGPMPPPQVGHVACVLPERQQAVVWSHWPGALQALLLFDAATASFCVPSAWRGTRTPKYHLGQVLVRAGGRALLVPSEGFPRALQWADLDTFQWSREPATAARGSALPREDLALVAAATIDGTVYVFGGNLTGDFSGSMWALDTRPAVPVWREVVRPAGSPWPCARKRAQAVAVGDRYLVMFGGLVTEVSNATDLWVFDARREQWHEVEARPGEPVPPPREASSLCEYHAFGAPEATHALLYGGCAITGATLGDLWALDLRSLRWRELRSASASVRGFSGHLNFVLGRHLFVHSGFVRPWVYNERMFKLDLPEAVLCPGERPDSAPARGWACIRCGCVTSRKCSKCGRVPLCSEECQEWVLETHGPQCFTPEESVEAVHRVAKLEAENKELREQLAQFTGKLQRQTAFIVCLRREVEERQQAIDLKSSVVGSLSERVGELKRELQGKTDLMQDLAAQMQDQTQKSAEATAQLAASVELLQRERSTLVSDICSKEKEALNLKSTVTDLVKQREDMQHRLAELDETKKWNEEEYHKALEKLGSTSIDLSKVSQEFRDLTTCPICCEPNVPRNCTLSGCGHVFCKPCAEAILQRSSMCPLCRTRFSTIKQLYM
eukprot:m51a1_g4108 hypothetical protein (637) ;mRNA; f:121254-123238